MRAIAREFASAEIAFVFDADGPDHDVRLRFFNARKEAAFVGHATIAAHAVLHGSAQDAAVRRQKSGTGIIEVSATGHGPPLFEFTQAAPVFEAPLPEPAAASILQALGSEPAALHPEVRISIARKGSSRALIALRNPDLLARLRIDFDALQRIGAEIGAEGFFVFAWQRSAAGVRTRSRMFCPAIGIPEDPVSGNAHAMLAALLWRHGVLSAATPRFTGLQGEFVQRPGEVFVTAEGMHDMSAARIAGYAVIVSCGELLTDGL